MAEIKAILTINEIKSIRKFHGDAVSTIVSYLNYDETILTPCEGKTEIYALDKHVKISDHYNRIETCQDQRIKHTCSDYNNQCIIFVSSHIRNTDQDMKSDVNKGIFDLEERKLKKYKEYVKEYVGNLKYNLDLEKGNKYIRTAFRVCIPNHEIYKKLMSLITHQGVRSAIEKYANSKHWSEHSKVIDYNAGICTSNAGTRIKYTGAKILDADNIVMKITDYYNNSLFCPYYLLNCKQCDDHGRINCSESFCRSCRPCHGYGYTKKQICDGTSSIIQECDICKGSGETYCGNCNFGKINCYTCDGKKFRIESIEKLQRSNDLCVLL